MRFLITGGAGFLGINLVRYLLANNHDVTSLDIVDFNYEDVQNKIKIIKGDIRNKVIVEEAVTNIDIVVHTAAALPLYSEQDIFSTDIDGTKNLLEASVKAGVKRFIHISSTAVYGIPDHHPLFENDKLEG
ncbi:MAG: NAD-dependent epimerase/dehydratase family protein, partial [Ignavibacteriaceae bacterium]